MHLKFCEMALHIMAITRYTFCEKTWNSREREAKKQCVWLGQIRTDIGSPFWTGPEIG